MATINNILSGSAGIKKRYQIKETMANIGAVVLVSQTGEGGLGLATNTGAQDMVGLNLTTATFTQTQGTGENTAESLIDIIINPDAVMRFRLSGGTSEGTALPLQTVTVASSGGTAIQTDADWTSTTVIDGVAWGYTGSNVSQIRKVTSVSSTTGTVAVPFDYGIVVDDVFLRGPVWPFDDASGHQVQLTAAFFEVNAIAAATAGGAFTCVDFDLRDAGDDGRNNSFVEVIAGDHFLNRIS